MMLEALSPLGGAFGDPAALAEVSLATTRERCDIGAVLVTVCGSGADSSVALSVVLGCDLPAAHGEFLVTGGKRAIWLTPHSWLVLCSLRDEADLVSDVAKAFPSHEAHASRFSDALGWLTLDGPAVDDLLRQGGFLSLEADGFSTGHAKRTLLAGIPAVILRENETRWTIGVERSRARYFVNWLASLTNAFGEQA